MASVHARRRMRFSFADSGPSAKRADERLDFRARNHSQAQQFRNASGQPTLLWTQYQPGSARHPE